MQFAAKGLDKNIQRLQLKCNKLLASGRKNLNEKTRHVNKITIISQRNKTVIKTETLQKQKKKMGTHRRIMKLLRKKTEKTQKKVAQISSDKHRQLLLQQEAGCHCHCCCCCCYFMAMFLWRWHVVLFICKAHYLF